MALSLVLLTGLPGTASALEQLSVQLRWDHQFQFAGFYVALWEGYYAEAGLDVALRSGIGPDGRVVDVIEEVRSGRASFGVGGVDVLVANDQGADMRIVATYLQQSPIAFFAPEAADLELPEDLQGLRIGTLATDDLTEIELRVLLRGRDIDPATLRRVQVGANKAVDLALGRIDVLPGSVISEPAILRGVGVPRHDELQPSAFGVPFPGDSLFATNAFIRENRLRVERFLEATERGWLRALENPETTVDRMLEALGRTAILPDPRASNLEMAREVRSLMYHPAVAPGHVNENRWMEAAAFLHANGEITEMPEPMGFLLDPAALRIERERQTFTLVVAALAITGLGALGALGWNRALRHAVASRTAELSRQRAMLRDMEESAQVGAWEYDPATEKLEWSDQTYQIHEISPETPITVERAIAFYSVEVRPSIRQSFERALADGTPFELELPLVTATGRRRWVQAIGRATFTSDGRVATLHGAFQDITDRRQAMLELRWARDRAEEANRAKLSFLARISHELRTPLNAIIGFSDVIKLRASALKPETTADYAADIHRAGTHLLELIDEILDFATIEDGRQRLSPVAHAASASVGEVLRMTRDQALRHGLDLRVDVPDDLPAILADKRAFRQVLMNVISNALKFTNPGGTVTVSAAPTETGDAVRFEVSDSGCGIPPEKLTSVFEPFTQVHNPMTHSVGGTGLGLSIVKRLVEAHGGAVEIQSVEDEGTTVAFTIPRAAPGARQPREHSPID